MALSHLIRMSSVHHESERSMILIVLPVLVRKSEWMVSSLSLAKYRKISTGVTVLCD